MDEITSGFLHAIRLIFSADPALYEIIFLSLRVTGLALVISTLIGVPTGAALGLSRVRARGFITALLTGGDYEQAAWLAVACGALVATGLGSDAGLAGLEAALNLLETARPDVAAAVRARTTPPARTG